MDGVWVFGMVERSPSRRIIMIPVENRSALTLINLLTKYVISESTIYSDCFRAYSHIKDHFDVHKQVNHSLSFVDSISNVHTNTIEGNWNGVKISIPARKRTKKLISMQLIRFMIKREYPNNMLEELLTYLN
jgi:transposase-like protein